MNKVTSSNSNCYNKIFEASFGMVLVTLVVFSIIAAIHSSNLPVLNSVSKTAPFIVPMFIVSTAISAIAKCKARTVLAKVDSEKLKEVPLGNEKISPEVENAITAAMAELETFFETPNSRTNEDEDWLKHVAKSRENILRAMNQVPDKNTVWVFAPGELEPLDELAKNFQKVVLIGRSPKITERAEISLKKNFLEKLYTDINAIFRNNPLEEGCLKALKQYFVAAQDQPIIDIDSFPKEKPDFIVCSLLISQFAQIERYIISLYEKLYGKQLERPFGLYDRACKQWILLLKKLIKPGGIIYFADSTKEYERYQDALERALTKTTDLSFISHQKCFPRFDLEEALKAQTFEITKFGFWYWQVTDDPFTYEISAYMLKETSLTRK